MLVVLVLRNFMGSILSIGIADKTKRLENMRVGIK